MFEAERWQHAKKCNNIQYFAQDLAEALLFMKHGVPINHVARAVITNDFRSFDYILASDNQVGALSPPESLGNDKPRVVVAFPRIYRT